MNRLSPSPAARDQRLADYAALRDGGALPVDAARDVGISDARRPVYERWYRTQRPQLPLRRPADYRLIPWEWDR